MPAPLTAQQIVLYISKQLVRIRQEIPAAVAGVLVGQCLTLRPSLLPAECVWLVMPELLELFPGCMSLQAEWWPVHEVELSSWLLYSQRQRSLKLVPFADGALVSLPKICSGMGQIRFLLMFSAYASVCGSSCSR